MPAPRPYRPPPLFKAKREFFDKLTSQRLIVKDVHDSFIVFDGYVEDGVTGELLVTREVAKDQLIRVA